MSLLSARPTPRPASEHTALVRKNRVGDASTLITIYLVLLFAIPSNVTVTGLGAMGRPAMLWGLALFAFWVLSRLQWRTASVERVPQPLRVALTGYIVVVLVSLSAALLRGLPADQVSPTLGSVVWLLSATGVVLVTMDGVDTMRDVAKLLRRIGVGMALLASLALLQVLTQQYLLDFWASVPGMELGFGGLAERDGQVRASATATHPLELVTTLTAGFSICIAAALTGGFRPERSKRSGFLWWVATGLIALVALTGLSRTALIGFAVVIAAMLPAVPPPHRLKVAVGGLVLGAGLVAVVPGLAGTTAKLFTGAAEDDSTTSRTDALARLSDFVSPSPIIGSGPGTFLPRYYIFDNQWAITAIELGVVGLALFGAMLLSGAWGAWNARSNSTAPDLRLAAHALTVSVVTVGLLFAFFDGLSFPISAGLLFVLLGLCACIRTVAAAHGAGIGGEFIREPQAGDAPVPFAPPVRVRP